MDPNLRPNPRRSSPTSFAALGISLLILVVGCGGPGGETRTAEPAAPAPSGVTNPTPAHATGLAPLGATEAARVVRVVDGDTIVIDRGRGNERVRYIGIDTPESVKPNTPVEFMAAEASAANEALVEGREVVLERDVSDVDRFDRLLRYIWLRDGDGWVFVNLELVRRGFAQVATYPPDVRWAETFLAAQRDARDAGAGLWGSVTPAP